MSLTLGVSLRCLGSVGLVEEANYLFDHVRSVDLCVPNSYNYNFLLEILSLFHSSICSKDLQYTIRKIVFLIRLTNNCYLIF